MTLVAFAMRRPVSLLSAIVAFVFAGLLAIDRMPRDIFPDLGVPTIYVAQPYGGMDPAQGRQAGVPGWRLICLPRSFIKGLHRLFMVRSTTPGT